MGSKKELRIYTIIGKIVLALYAVTAAIFMISLITLHILPAMMLGIIALVLAIIGVILSFCQGHTKLLSIVGSSILLIFAIGFLIGIFYIRNLNITLEEVTTPEVQTDVVSVYVLRDDPAETIEDTIDYQFGIVRQEAPSMVNETIANINAILGTSIRLNEYDDAFAVLTALRNGESNAVILDEAFVGIVANHEDFEWVHTELRALFVEEFEVEVPIVIEPPEEIPDSFILYLTGIDTYGGVSARSRSDVNILVVVNTTSKEILLLSTPRDAYVTFDMAGDARDKLAHAGIYGVDQSIDALEDLYGINIDYFVRMNFTGFMEIIDALGGVTVYSEHDFYVENIRSYTVGPNHLTGIEALAFARERMAFADGDFQRARNQMEVIRAVAVTAASPALLMNFNQMMNAISGSFETNMPRDQIAQLARMQLSDMAEWTITSYTTTGNSSMGETFSMPGHMLYIINMNPYSIEEARDLIRETMGLGDVGEVDD
ncbi:MAG: LCP family protein [Lachnospiraceae bacterium]|nr:LCP family protein [Lachnospiraceae bacterium]